MVPGRWATEAMNASAPQAYTRGWRRHTGAVSRLWEASVHPGEPPALHSTRDVTYVPLGVVSPKHGGRAGWTENTFNPQDPQV